MTIQEEEDYSVQMETLGNMLRPAPFKLSNRDDPEQLLQDWNDYTDQFELFLDATNAAGDHADNHVNCNSCKKAKSMLRLIGGREVEVLFKHTGMVVAGDSWTQILNKIKEGVR